MTQGRYVSYINLSTAEVGRSEIELSRQRAAVGTYLLAVGAQLIDEFQSIGTSGSAHHGSTLRGALDLCRHAGATLLIAELEPLSRDSAFLPNLRRLLEQFGVRFAAADMPEANEVTLGIMMGIAGVASSAIRAVSDTNRSRKRAFLVRLTDQHRREEPAHPADTSAARVPACKPRTLEQAAQIAPLLAEIRAAGATTFEQVAYALNELGIPSARGMRWYPSQVRRVEQRIASVS